MKASVKKASQTDNQLWASIEATLLSSALGLPYNSKWVAGAASRLVRMVTRSGYTRDAALYEVASGLGLTKDQVRS
jgi:hypothetical protein